MSVAYQRGLTAAMEDAAITDSPLPVGGAAAAACDESETTIPSDWILQGERELKARPQPVDIRQPGDAVPSDHCRRMAGLVNAAFAETLRRPLTPADWDIVMTLEAVARHMAASAESQTP